MRVIYFILSVAGWAWLLVAAGYVWLKLRPARARADDVIADDGEAR